MAFKKETIEAIRAFSKTMTISQIAEKMKMSRSTLCRILRENKDIKPFRARAGRPPKF